MTVFQAYCSNIDDPSIWRFVLTFPDSNVADEWWRAISDTPSIASLFTRVNPQFYTQTPNSFNISYFFTDARTRGFASNFKGRFFMTLINDQPGRNIPTISNSNVANAISGNWFFIRSTVEPKLYWCYNPNYSGNRLRVSATERTAFRISAVDKTTAGKVLIGTDPVTVQLDWLDRFIGVNNAKDLLAGNDAQQFLFGDLKNKIRYIPGHDLLKDNSNSNEISGWKWELAE